MLRRTTRQAFLHPGALVLVLILALCLLLVLLNGCSLFGRRAGAPSQGTAVAAQPGGVAEPVSPAAGAPATGPAVNPGPAAGGSGAGAMDPASLLLTSVKLTQVEIARGEYLRPGDTAQVGTGPVTLAFSFKGAMAGTALDSMLEVQAPEPPRPYWSGGDLLVLAFPPGRDGDRVTVRLPQGVPLPDGGQLTQDVVYTFVRAEGAGVAFAINGEGIEWPQPNRTWLPVSGRVEVELRFSAPVNRDSVAQVVRTNARSGGDKDLDIAFLWQDDTAGKLVVARQPGEELLINLNGAVDKQGSPLHVLGPPLRLRWEEPSSFWAVAPDGKDATVVARLPHPITGAMAGPGGLRIAYLEQDQQTLPRLWLWHVGSGQRWDTGMRVPGLRHLAWVNPARLLVLAGNKLWLVDGENRNAYPLATGSVVALGGSGDGVAAWLNAVSVGSDIRYDLHLRSGDGPEQVLTGVVTRPAVGTAALVMPVALSRDGRWAALPLSASPVPALTLVDLARAPTDGSPPETREVPVDAPVQSGPLAFSPDGAWILAGEQLIQVRNGQTVTRVRGAVSAYWSPGGERILFTAAAGPTAGGPRVFSVSGGNQVSLQGREGIGWTATGYALVR